MKNVLNRKTVTVDRIGQIEIIELSARASIEIAEAYRKDRAAEAAFIACKNGVVEWAEESIDNIAASCPLSVLQELAGHIYTLSGLIEDEEKNSDSAPSDVSSLGSRRISK